jgi:4-hydroxybenzoate polyprenyltransferase
MATGSHTPREEDATAAKPQVPAASAEEMLLPAAMRSVPLCVDLDGTLVKSDTLLDSVLALVRQRPLEVVKIPGWIRQGKAHFKQQVTGAVALDVAHLPWNHPLLEWLREEHGAGREIYLVTAADRRLAERVAAYVGIFSGVLASDGATNLAAHNKTTALQHRFPQGFSYVGNAAADIGPLAASVAPVTANSTSGLRRALRATGRPMPPSFDDRTPKLRVWLRALRLHQWAKNTLIFVPMLLAHAWALAPFAECLLAFVSFSLCASATYMINDLLDIEADRVHPRKCRRAFAAGDLSPITGVGAVLVMLLAAFALAAALPPLVDAMPSAPLLPHAYGFVLWLGIYLVTTLLYSLVLKRRLLLDVFVLSGLYTVRLLAGSAATGIAMSGWLTGFSVFFFLSLAFVKRFSELEGLRERGGTQTTGRGYSVGDLEQVRALGTGAMYAAVVVLTLYIYDAHTVELYQHVKRLWLVVPVLLLWLSRVWMLASRGEMHDDPVVFAVTDKRSLLLGALMALVILWAV